MQHWRLLWVLILLCLMACTTAVTGTPTPFPTPAIISTLPINNNQPVPLNLVDLIANPEAAEGRLVQVTGQYFRLPKLFCETDPHPSAATWQLTADEDIALAGNFDGELRRLLPDGLTLTVEGYWLRWRGPIGCGKQAEVQEIWYLQTRRIVDPSPLARVTLTPFLPGVDVAEVTPGGQPATSNPLTPTLPLTPTTSAPVLTPTVTLTPTEPIGNLPTATNPIATAVLPTTTPTFAATAVLTPTVAVTTTPTIASGPTITPTATVTLGPGTPSVTPGAVGTPTMTNTPDPNVTPSLTPTPGANGVLVQEEIEPMDLTKETLGNNQTHAWPFVVASSEIVTVTVVTADSANLVLSIVNSGGTTLVERNNAGDRGIETIGSFAINTPGTFSIYVKTTDGRPAEYVLMLLFEDSVNFIFQPIIDYGATVNANLPAVSEHFWHFAGLEGQAVTIRVLPDATTDVFLELYGPDADRISAPFISVGTAGAMEQLEFDLPDDGLYSIRVGEWDFEEGSYQLTLEED